MTKRIIKILENLKKQYPDARCELEYKNPFELIIATVLSAQSTDKQVNFVTKNLFEKYKTPQDILKTSEEEFINDIKSIGLYRNKAKNIRALCLKLITEFDSKVPNTMQELVSLNGVGRKTANVVLSNAFNIPALAVDTHVFRVTHRLGISSSKTADQTELELKKKIDKKLWSISHHLFIFHGRRCCSARNPKCNECIISLECDYYKNNILEF